MKQEFKAAKNTTDFIMQAKLEKLAELRERRKNINITDRPKPVIKDRSQPQKATEAEEAAPAVKRDFQVWKKEVYFQYREMKVVEKMDQSMQTEVVAKDVEMQRFSLIKKGRSSTIQLTTPLISERPSMIGEAKESLALDDIKDESREQIEKLRNELLVSIPEPKAELSETEAEKLARETKFHGFFLQASKFIEKALSSDEGGFSRVEGTASGTGIGTGAAAGVQGRDVEAEVEFKLPTEMEGKMVSFVDWSSLIPEVCLSVYGERDSMLAATSASDKIYIWNSNFSSRAEFELNSGAKVSRAIFSPFNSEYVVSGLECGRLYLYDLRAKRDPVLKSLPLNESHKSAITGLDFIGGQNSNNIVSVSEEGKLCLWNLAKLDYPVKSVEILAGDRKKDDDIAFPLEPFCLSIIPGDTSSVYLGVADACVYQCTVLGANSSDKLLDRTFKSHSSVVTALSHNKASSVSNLVSNAMLSGSLDWTVKLWNVKNAEPLYTFLHHGAPITDVQWNPGHPALFVSSDSEGKVAVVDLYQDFDNPVWTTKLNSAVLNAKWDVTGRFLALTDDQGAFIVKKFAAGLLNSKAGDLSVYESFVQ